MPQTEGVGKSLDRMSTRQVMYLRQALAQDGDFSTHDVADKLEWSHEEGDRMALELKEIGAVESLGWSKNGRGLTGHVTGRAREALVEHTEQIRQINEQQREQMKQHDLLTWQDFLRPSAPKEPPVIRVQVVEAPKPAVELNWIRRIFVWFGWICRNEFVKGIVLIVLAGIIARWLYIKWGINLFDPSTWAGRGG